MVFHVKTRSVTLHLEQPCFFASRDVHFLPRTLAQLACQDFKKEPSDSSAVPSPQSSYASHILQWLSFGSIIGAQVSFWTSHDTGSLPTVSKSLVQVDCHSCKIEHLDGLAALMLCSNALITLKIFPVTKFLAASISIPKNKLPALKVTVGELQKLNSYTIYAMEFEAASNGESLDNPDPANMSLPSTTNGEPQDAFDFSGQQNLPSNETLTCFTPSLSHRDFPALMISLLVMC